ncbi:MAG: hypothetical protein ACM3WV_08870 [Bacillota bacterium]
MNRFFIRTAYLFLMMVVLATAARAAPAGDGASAGASGGFPPGYGRIFLKLNLSRTRIFAGERVPVSITLYYEDLRVYEVDYPLLNPAEFYVEDFGQPRQSSVTLNDITYQIIRFDGYLTPLKAGDLSLGPAVLKCKVVQAPEDDSQAHAADPGSVLRRSLDVASNKTRVHVLPLPSRDYPAHFSGGVGVFYLRTESDNTGLRQGVPCTVRLIVSGTGNLARIKAPVWPDARGWKIFPARRISESASRRAVFEQVVIPLDAGLTRIGPYVLEYFDPAAEKYFRVLSGLNITVRPDPVFQRSRNLPRHAEKSPKTADIKGILGASLRGYVPWPQRPWFWRLQFLPVAVLAVTLFYRNYRLMMESDFPRVRAAKAWRRADQRLSASRILLEKEEYAPLLEELHSTLKEYLGARFNLPCAGMTGAVADILVKAGDMPESVLQQIRGFFAEYDDLRFAGKRLGPEEAGRLRESVRRIIVALKRIKPVTLEAGWINNKAAEKGEKRNASAKPS